MLAAGRRLRLVDEAGRIHGFPGDARTLRASFDVLAAGRRRIDLLAAGRRRRTFADAGRTSGLAGDTRTSVSIVERIGARAATLEEGHKDGLPASEASRGPHLQARSSQCK